MNQNHDRKLKPTNGGSVSHTVGAGIDAAGGAVAGTAIGPRGQVYEPRRLTVPQLRRYIRGGCFCSVCELARAEIRVWELGASEGTEARVEGRASSGGRHRDGVASLAAGLDQAIEHVKEPAGRPRKAV